MFRNLVELDAAERLDDLRVPPGNRLEALKGDRRRQHSTLVNDAWLVCFRARDGDAHDLSVPPRRIDEIVHGKRAVTADTALRLARYFGTSERFWRNLQARYDLELERDRLGPCFEEEVAAYPRSAAGRVVEDDEAAQRPAASTPPAVRPRSSTRALGGARPFSYTYTSPNMTDLLTAVDEAGVVAIEGPPGRPVLAGAGDVDRLLEACFGADCGAALLHAENLPAAFFDLSSGVAGTMLQKLRLYGVRLAVVRGAEAASSRFGELVAEERMRRDFGVFASRLEARAWLAA